MKPRTLPNQIAFDLFDERPSPTWDDVQKGRAELIDVIEPCDGEQCMFWQGGECVHVPGKYAYPKKRTNGMCLKHHIVWAA